jgi:hypothetical protein
MNNFPQDKKNYVALGSNFPQGKNNNIDLGNNFPYEESSSKAQVFKCLTK